MVVTVLVELLGDERREARWEVVARFEEGAPLGREGVRPERVAGAPRWRRLLRVSEQDEVGAGGGHRGGVGEAELAGLFDGGVILPALLLQQVVR